MRVARGRILRRAGAAWFYCGVLSMLAVAAPLVSGKPAKPSNHQGDVVTPAEWLDEKISLDEAEGARSGLRDKWAELKAQMKPGDEIWTFASPPESWKHLAGRSGFALVRNGVAIMTIVIMMN